MHRPLTAAAALLIPTTLTPAESPRWGDGLPGTLLWLAFPAVWLLFSLGKPLRLFRLHVADGAALALFVWHSAAAVIAALEGMPRTAVNALWLWLGLGACYFCIRQAARSPRDARLLVALMCGLAAAQSVLGCYQTLWGIPSARAEFNAAQRSVTVAGLHVPDDSPVRMLFEARLGGNEPLGTFTLTNSLAGWLVPWIVLLVWIVCDSLRTLRKAPDTTAATNRRPKTTGQRSEQLPWYFNIVALVRFVGLLAVLVVAMFTLIRTGSRTGLAAMCIGVGLLALPWARHEWSSRVASKRLLIVGGSLVIVGAFVFAAISGGVAASMKSLQYRFDYWKTTAAIIADRPWLGCGPGQFQQAYTAAKAPPAGEEPSDPHNALLEIWATAGTPAAVAWLAFCGLVGLAVFRAERRAHPTCPNGRAPRHEFGKSARRSNRDPAHTPRGFRSAAIEFVRGLAPGVAALMVGYVVFVPVAWMTRAVLSTGLVWASLPAALVCLGLLGHWVQHGRLPIWVVAVAWVALIINLSASGGIGFPGVAAVFWVLAAICLNHSQAESPIGAFEAAPSTDITNAPQRQLNESSASELSGASVQTAVRAGSSRPALIWPALAISFGLVYACHATAYRPVLQSSAEMLAAERLSAAADPLPALAGWQAAIAADPWAFEPRAALAAAQFALWRQTPHPDRWPPIRELLDSASARAVNWSAAWLWKGRLLLDAAQAQTADGKPAAPRAAADAVEAFRQAVRCYPASPTNWAHLAVAEDRLGLAEARQTARHAIQLDAENPHRDKKVPDPLRQTLQAISLKE